MTEDDASSAPYDTKDLCVYFLRDFDWQEDDTRMLAMYGWSES